MMKSVNIPNWAYLVIMLVILIVGGVAEYVGLAPHGNFYVVFWLVIGLIAPSPAFPHTLVQTPEANINAQKVSVQPPPTTS